MQKNKQDIDHQMTAEDVVNFYRELEDMGIKIWIEGGWGADALLEKQTRVHHDLDIIIQKKDVEEAEAMLFSRGYYIIPRDDLSELNFHMEDNSGHEIDFTVLEFDEEGNGIYGSIENGEMNPKDSFNGIGKINDYQVRCVSPEYAVAFRTGYELRDIDYQDVKALCKKFDIEMPEEYKSTDYLTDDYHKQLAERYEKRKLDLNPDDLVDVAAKLGFIIDPNTVVKSTGGNVSGTFIAGDYVIKIQKDQDRHEFLANKIVSEKLMGKAPVVEVLTYDWFEKTEYEVLIMRRGEGKLLLEDFYKLPVEQQESLFSQLFDIVNTVSSIEMSDFGEIRLGHSFKSFKEYQLHELEKYSQIILDQKLCQEKDIQTITDYIYKNINVFEDDKKSYLNHTDLHTGNILYKQDKLTLLFDFDGAVKGPKYLTLPKIIGAINDPSQFVEGTPYFDYYKDKKFDHLLAILREKMPSVLEIPNLTRKLNLCGIIEGLKWISENWSAEWNKNQIKNLLENESVSDNHPLEMTYYGKIINKVSNGNG